MKSFTIKVSSLLVLFAVSVTGYACPTPGGTGYNNTNTEVLSDEVFSAIAEQYQTVLGY